MRRNSKQWYIKFMLYIPGNHVQAVAEVADGLSRHWLGEGLSKPKPEPTPTAPLVGSYPYDLHSCREDLGVTVKRGIL